MSTALRSTWDLVAGATIDVQVNGRRGRATLTQHVPSGHTTLETWTIILLPTDTEDDLLVGTCYGDYRVNAVQAGNPFLIVGNDRPIEVYAAI